MAANELKMNDAGFAATAITVSKKNAQSGKHEPVGKVEIYVPTLEAFGIEAAVKEIGDDGLPVYEDKAKDWLFSAAIAAVKAKARNALISGTADLKPGLSIATNFDELTAEAERGGGAEALAVVRELKAKMGEWLANVEKKSAGTQAFINGLFANRQALSLQSEANRTKMQDYIGRFADWLSDSDIELAEKGSKYLQSLMDAASTAAVTDDF